MFIFQGTSEYMSPSTVNGKPSGPEGDLWALGVVMYQCITGEIVCVRDRGSVWLCVCECVYVCVCVIEKERERVCVCVCVCVHVRKCVSASLYF